MTIQLSSWCLDTWLLFPAKDQAPLLEELSGWERHQTCGQNSESNWFPNLGCRSFLSLQSSITSEALNNRAPSLHLNDEIVLELVSKSLSFQAVLCYLATWTSSVALRHPPLGSSFFTSTSRAFPNLPDDFGCLFLLESLSLSHLLQRSPHYLMKFQVIRSHVTPKTSSHHNRFQLVLVFLSQNINDGRFNILKP